MIELPENKRCHKASFSGSEFLNAHLNRCLLRVEILLPLKSGTIDLTGFIFGPGSLPFPWILGLDAVGFKLR